MNKTENDADKIFEELKKYFMNEFSKTFSDKVVSLAYEPSNVGSLENPEGHGRISGSCGDTMEIYINAKGERIEEITFLTDGCGATLACGSAVTELAKGKTIREAETIDVLSVLEYLDDLPPSHEHCAVLAVKTFHCALKSLK